jgi:hypothetical protein
MNGCSGKGECFEQTCGCKNEGEDQEFDVCDKFDCTIKYSRKDSCLHGCELKECHNYRFCGQKRPQYILNTHGDLCVDCTMMIGKIEFLDVKGDCPVCLEHKDIIQIPCENHRLCLKCWISWSNKTKQYPLTCPLCRKGIWEMN